MAVELGTGLVALASGAAIGLSAIAAAIAEKEIGVAAVGAMAEKEELFKNGTGSCKGRDNQECKAAGIFDAC